MKDGPVPLALALRWVSEAADAIQHAHERGVIHCDLKPSNLLLDAAGHVRVTDFGLARSLADDGPSLHGGTVGYLAPEQAEGAVSPRTDVHGLGAVLYALLAGQPPCVDGRRGEPLATLRPDVPPDVAELCERCLAPRPEDRPASAGEVADALRAQGSFLVGQGAGRA
jgi:serine/threonine-protein kinase